MQTTDALELGFESMEEVRCPHCGTRQRPTGRCRFCAADLSPDAGPGARPEDLAPSLGWWALFANELGFGPKSRVRTEDRGCSLAWSALIAVMLGTAGALVLSDVGSRVGALVGATAAIVLGVLAGVAFGRDRYRARRCPVCGRKHGRGGPAHGSCPAGQRASARPSRPA